MRELRRTCLSASLLVVALSWATAQPAVAAGTWTWPVTGPVIRGFDPPASPFGSGHRGIDIAAPAGSVAVAPADGRVSFAGPVGGRLFLTMDHGAGLESTFSWVSALLVRRGDLVTQGQPVVRTGGGHTGDLVPNLHLGVKLDDAYVDPLDYLGEIDVSTLIRLAPLVA
ncbi:MAG TPA: M23 family metallopeptidase, partial [Actinomycetota bacterium]